MNVSGEAYAKKEITKLKDSLKVVGTFDFMNTPYNGKKTFTFKVSDYGFSASNSVALGVILQTEYGKGVNTAKVNYYSSSTMSEQKGSLTLECEVALMGNNAVVTITPSLTGSTYWWQLVSTIEVLLLKYK